MGHATDSKRSEAGFGLVEVLVAVAILGTLMAGITSMLTNANANVKSLELRVERLDLSAAVSQVDCTTTLSPANLGGLTAAAFCDGRRPLILRKSNNQFIFGGAPPALIPEGNFAGSRRVAGEWHLRATCDGNSIIVDFARGETSGTAFKLNPAGGPRFDWAHPMARVYGGPRGPALCSSAIGRGIVARPQVAPCTTADGNTFATGFTPGQGNFCQSIDASQSFVAHGTRIATLERGLAALRASYQTFVNSVSATACPGGVRSISSTGAVSCAPLPSCGAGRVLTGVDAAGNAICTAERPLLAGIGCSEPTPFLVGTNADGSARCGGYDFLSPVEVNIANNAGDIQETNNTNALLRSQIDSMNVLISALTTDLDVTKNSIYPAVVKEIDKRSLKLMSCRFRIKSKVKVPGTDDASSTEVDVAYQDTVPRLHDCELGSDTAEKLSEDFLGYVLN